MANNATGMGMAALVIVSLMRGWLVPGPMFDRVVNERDRALNLMYELAETARRAIEAGERKGP